VAQVVERLLYNPEALCSNPSCPPQKVYAYYNDDNDDKEVYSLKTWG
jgi:hypothetical protein